MERKRKMSIMVRLLLMVIPPCLLLGIAMTLYSGWNMHRGMQKTTLDGMRATDYAVLEMFETVILSRMQKAMFTEESTRFLITMS